MGKHLIQVLTLGYPMSMGITDSCTSEVLSAAFFGCALFCLSYTTSFLPSSPLLPGACRHRLTANCVLLQPGQGTQVQAPPSAPGQSGMWVIMTTFNNTAIHRWRPGKHTWIQIRNVSCCLSDTLKVCLWAVTVFQEATSCPLALFF